VRKKEKMHPLHRKGAIFLHGRRKKGTNSEEKEKVKETFGRGGGKKRKIGMPLTVVTGRPR